jgi:CHASE1-domain containing sensor protein
MLVFGLMTSIALSFTMYSQERRAEQAHFERRAQFRIAAVHEGITNAIDALQVVNQFFVTNGHVSREQFHSFTKPLRALSLYRGIQFSSAGLPK